ncbi:MULTISPECIES: hypothetical protein [Paraburkholderia]|jgi:hypothetical protein|uniref:Uncharacterized protein n=1 Tax=Paraburkholderia phenazinium TaxID=60549 RepID=A0A1N6KRE0_9BURK|nr:hypothetical protein [Paraburkholderia phenazinium]SIO59101.1 hypothetical protein SAMN05444165_4394 [Paraburkholderia phenazinium]
MARQIPPDNRHLRDNEPLRDGTSLMAFLHVLKKAHIELDGHAQAHQRFQRVTTRGEARQYIEDLMPPLLAERDRQRRARR